MSKLIQFEMQGNLLCVRVDGVLLYKPRLDTKVVKNAVKNKAISPQMKSFMFNGIVRELRDNGCDANDVKYVVSRFEEEFVA